jgi:hypothetical protein
MNAAYLPQSQRCFNDTEHRPSGRQSWDSEPCPALKHLGCQARICDRLCYYRGTMKNLTVIIWILLSSVFLIALDYEIKAVKVLPIESYPAQATVGGVTIAADPYATNKKSMTAFDVKDLNTRGYFPIHLIIQNRSQTFLFMRTRDIILINSSGQHLYTIPATVVVDDVVGANEANRFPSMKSHDSLTVPKIGSPLSDFTNKDIANRLLEPDTVADGFVFFFSPSPQKNFFAESTLYIPRLEEEGTHKALGPFSIPLASALSPLNK